jgi:hypothetical protein
MDDDGRRSRGRRSRRGRRGWGCGGFLFVLIVGLALSLFNTDIGVGLSVRIPFTQSNLTLAASIGAKEKTVNALPDYTHGRLGGNQNFINQSQTLTIGPAEGATLIVLGQQAGAPAIDLHLVAH